MSNRRTFLIAARKCRRDGKRDCRRARADPAARSCSPTCRTTRRASSIKALNAAFAKYWKAKTGQSHHPAVARRLGQAGALGDRRAGGRRGDPGAGRRHRRHRPQAKLLPPDWQSRLPNNTTPYTSTIVFLVRKGNPKDQGLGRPRQAGRRGHHAQSQDLRRRALELSRRLGLWLDASTAATRPRRGTSSTRALQQRAGARHRRARLDHHLRPARHRRRAVAWENEAFLALEEFGADKFEIVVPVALDPGRAAGGAGRQGRRQARHPHGGRGLSEFLYTPAAQEIIAKNFYRPRKPEPPPAKYARSFPRSSWSPSTTGVRRLGQGAGRRISPMAASSTRSTSPAAGRPRDEPSLAPLAAGRRRLPAERAAGLRHHLRLCRQLSFADRPDPARRTGAGAPVRSGLDGIWRVATAPRVLAALQLSFFVSAAAARSMSSSARSWRGCWCATTFPASVFSSRRRPALRAAHRRRRHRAGGALRHQWLDRRLAHRGIKIAFTPLGIFIALVFIGLPFVVRTVQPVLAGFRARGRRGLGDAGRRPRPDRVPRRAAGPRAGASNRRRARLRANACTPKRYIT